MQLLYVEQLKQLFFSSACVGTAESLTKKVFVSNILFLSPLNEVTFAFSYIAAIGAHVFHI